MKKVKFEFAAACVAMFCVLFLSACHDRDYYREERIRKAAEHFEEIETFGFKKGKLFTLPECIELAIKQNLDLRVFELRQAVAKEQKTAELLGMLPELNVVDDLTQRSNTPGSSSRNIRTGAQTYAASQSAPTGLNEFKLELALSVLDFGLAYLNTLQASDRVLLRGQETKRAGQNLTLDVVKAYFRVASAQEAIEITEELIKKCEKIQRTLDELAKSRTVSVMRILDERKRFIRLEKRLIAYRRSYQNACIELRSLMGFRPNEEIRVDVSGLNKIAVQKLPKVQTIEQIALAERPELYELDIQENITTTESYKTILMMLPNVRAYIDFMNSSNKFLYYQSWWEIGIRAAYNLLKLPERIAEYHAIEAEIDEIALKTLALSIGVMSQVRIAHANLTEVQETYELDERVYQAYLTHLETAKRDYKESGSLSKLELDRLELETAETQINRTLSLGAYYVAYYRLLNVTGVRSLDEGSVKGFLAEVKRRKERRNAKKVAARAQKASLELQRSAQTFNGIALGNNTLTELDRQKLVGLVEKQESGGKSKTPEKVQ